MSDADVQREIGRLGATVERLEDDVRDLRRMTADMHTTITEARGGWKTLLAVGALSSALTTACLKFWTLIRGLH